MALGRLIINAATRLASDPRVRAKAADILEKEVKPRAAAAWVDAKPKLDAARAELRDIARTTSPRDDPRGFAAEVKRRFVDRKGSA
jgi:hypothetical protein